MGILRYYKVLHGFPINQVLNAAHVEFSGSQIVISQIFSSIGELPGNPQTGPTTCGGCCWIPPRKLTWNLQMMVSNRNLLFQGFIFRFHTSFPGVKLGMCFFTCGNFYDFLFFPIQHDTHKYRSLCDTLEKEWRSTMKSLWCTEIAVKKTWWDTMLVCKHHFMGPICCGLNFCTGFVF